MVNNGFITGPQAARMLGVTNQTLGVWRKRGIGPTYLEITPRSFRYRVEDIENFIRERTRTAS